MEPLQVHLTSIHCVSTVVSYVIVMAETFDPYFPFKSPNFYPTLKIHQSLKYTLNSPDLSLEDPRLLFHTVYRKHGPQRGRRPRRTSSSMSVLAFSRTSVTWLLAFLA